MSRITCILALLLAVALAACFRGIPGGDSNTDPPREGFTYSTLPPMTPKPAASPTYTGTVAAPTKGNPDLAIEMSLNGVFHWGQSGSYTVLVSNVGNGTASSPISVVDTLPESLTFDSYSSPYSSGWASSVSGQQVTFTYTGPDISPGGSLPTLIINVKIVPMDQFDQFYGSADAVDNYAQVRHPNDGNPTNNQSHVRTVIKPAGAAGAR